MDLVLSYVFVILFIYCTFVMIYKLPNQFNVEIDFNKFICWIVIYLDTLTLLKESREKLIDYNNKNI